MPYVKCVVAPCTISWNLIIQSVSWFIEFSFRSLDQKQERGGGRGQPEEDYWKQNGRGVWVVRMEWGRKHRWAFMPRGLYQMKLVFKKIAKCLLCSVGCVWDSNVVLFPSRNLSAPYSDIKKLSDGLALSWERRKCLLPWNSRRSLKTGVKEVRWSLGKDAAVSFHLLGARSVWRLTWLRVL